MDMDKLFQKDISIPDKLKPEQMEKSLAHMSDQEYSARKNKERYTFDWKAAAVAASVAVVFGIGILLSGRVSSNGNDVQQMAELSVDDDSQENAMEELAAEHREAAFQVVYDYYQDVKDSSPIVWKKSKILGGAAEDADMNYESGGIPASLSDREDTDVASGEESFGASGSSRESEAEIAAGGISVKDGNNVSGNDSIAREVADEDIVESDEEHSETNVRTKGVEEGDVVKTDGEYLYVLDRQKAKIQIYRAHGKDVEKVSDIALKKYKLDYDSDSLYIQGDRLIVMGSRYLNNYYSYSWTCGNWEESDEDKVESTNPNDSEEQEKSASQESTRAAISGNTTSSAISQQQLDGTLDEETDQQLEKDAASNLESYIKRHEEDDCLHGCDGFTQTLIFDINDRSEPKLLRGLFQEGSAHSSRITEGILYIFSHRSMSILSEPELNKPQTYLPKVQGKCISGENVEVQKDYDGADYTVISSVSLEGQDYVDQLAVLGGSEQYVSGDSIYLYHTSYHYEDKESMEDEASDPADSKETENDEEDDINWVQLYEGEWGQMYTEITKIHYADGIMTQKAEGRVLGEIKDDYCMDEKDGYLRLVCTYWGKKGTDKNALYILDDDLKETGSIKNLAKRESIYSARFLGELAYFVTYENTDPLFAADVSDPENPRILSELKLPGFSSYLHPFGDGLLLGIGMETDEEGLEVGLKLSMFDISDPMNMKEIDKMVLEGIENASVLYNPNALLVDTQGGFFGTGLEKTIYDEDGLEYDISLSYGIFTYDKEHGFKKHVIGKEIAGRKLWKYLYTRQDIRGVTIGDYLYILCPGEEPAAYRLDEVMS